MASPLGHSLAGLAVALWALPAPPPGLRDFTRWLAQHRWTVLALVVWANLPDLDYLPGVMAGELNRFHRGFTHSLPFAAVVTGIAWLLHRKSTRLRGPFTACFLAVFGHILIDWMAADGRAPFGIPLWAPFSETSYQFPWPLFPSVDKSTLFAPQNFFAAGVEWVLLGGLCLLIYRSRRAAASSL